MTDTPEIIRKAIWKAEQEAGKLREFGPPHRDAAIILLLNEILKQQYAQRELLRQWIDQMRKAA